MKILAFETTDRTGSLAALDGPQLLRQIALDPKQRSAQSFSPALVELWREVGWRPADIELVATAAGPGSFTGLRVGVTAAKTLAYLVGCPLLGVDALEVIAWQVAATSNRGKLWAVIDAQRQQVFAAQFCLANHPPTVEVARPTQILDNAAWLIELQPGDMAAGPVLEKLAPRLPAEVVAASQSTWRPQAASVGQLAYQQFQQGRRDDPFQLVPNYQRKSAAEEQRGW